jgi:hypothetical protein
MRSRHIPGHVKKTVYERDGGKCVYCGSTINLEYDHIIPFSKGGSNNVGNIQLACSNCNREKRDHIDYTSIRNSLRRKNQVLIKIPKDYIIRLEWEIEEPLSILSSTHKNKVALLVKKGKVNGVCTNLKSPLSNKYYIPLSKTLFDYVFVNIKNNHYYQFSIVMEDSKMLIIRENRGLQPEFAAKNIIGLSIDIKKSAGFLRTISLNDDMKEEYSENLANLIEKAYNINLPLPWRRDFLNLELFYQNNGLSNKQVELFKKLKSNKKRR